MKGGSDQPTELNWRVNGLNVAGLAWGKPDARPVLALHGWLDNAASFLRLAPLLTEHYVVALDLSGHGHSDHRSADASYQIWDDLPEIVAVVDAMGWTRFDLVGHSRGAIISALLAAAYADRVEHLVLLDAVTPEPVAPEKFPLQMRKAIDDKQRLMKGEHRILESVDAAVRSRSQRGLSEFAARAICERNLAPCEGGYRWRTDKRLHGASPVKMSQDQIDAVLAALEMPVLLLLAAREREEYWAWMEQHARTHIGNLQVASVDGGHHFHMEECAQEVAQRLCDFLGAEREVAN